MYRCNEKGQKITRDKLIEIYHKLLDFYGPQGWWPAESQFEVIIGAILTQAVSWKNVEKAINNLKNENKLSFVELEKISTDRLANLIKPAGYYNIKAERLKNFIKAISGKYNGNIKELFKRSLKEARKELLNISGIGPETADSILLYAGDYHDFVVDAYTIRLFSRMGLIKKNIKYDKLRLLFMENLPEDITIYKEFHALIVAHCKEFCLKKQPDCTNCIFLK